MHPFYIQQLFHELKAQSEKLGQMEQLLQQLRKDVDGLMSKSQTHIERVDYHFDLLKIEKLEGTLNIGMNSNDGKNLEDITVNGQSMEQIQKNPDQSEMIRSIEQPVLSYLQDEIPELIRVMARERKIQIDSPYTHMIIDDVRRQINDRILIYLEKIQTDEEEIRNKDYIRTTVIEHMKRDIEIAVKQHIERSFSGKWDVNETERRE
ncbi:spore germination protein PC [Paenibacillus uliginis N3/975]|uniref:Spore germination protein PC n=1 Tax=Paenibacillus uliginis N3/975 TaxID=1313296 RepID=A0A1X7HG56_9BACL|nr:spore germination protein GerPC [Paenibacillus uliginis]SMF86145.1 spore germination protein PC [Paenibacillus uliginis N3/975]